MSGHVSDDRDRLVVHVEQLAGGLTRAFVEGAAELDAIASTAARALERVGRAIDAQRRRRAPRPGTARARDAQVRAPGADELPSDVDIAALLRPITRRA